MALIVGSPSNTPQRLVEILKALPSGELDSLVSRLRVRIDPAKRLDPPQQIARALVALPELRDPTRLPPASAELLHRIAEARGSLVVSSLPPSVEPLVERGVLFVRSAGKGRVELVLPSAYLVQLRSWEGEDPRGVRALLAQASPETLGAIAGHYLGRPATTPVALSLEAAWEALGEAESLAAEIEKLSGVELRVLEGVEGLGGEADTEELLDLEREPLRLRNAAGATASRRGVGFSLERRGLLIPVHPNRHVVPTEVARIIGHARNVEREQRREQVRAFVVSGDHAPTRARFSTDPGAGAMAFAFAMREPGYEVRPTLGTPKSLVAKLATRFGRDPEQVALLVALSRAIGLCDASAVQGGAPPGSHTLHELSALLFRAWRMGGAWDEARADPEMLRLPPEQRDSSASGIVRELALEALRDLGENRWIPWSSLEGFVRADHRISGVERLLRRWADRVGAPPVTAMEVARRVVLESLPSLGILDIGEEDTPHAIRHVAIRLTPRGRALVAGHVPPQGDATSAFHEPHVLRLGGSATVSSILGVFGFADLGRTASTLELLITPQTIAHALAAGYDADLLRLRIEAIAPLPESLSRTLAEASVVRGRSTYSPASGFLWVDDPNVCELLRSRRGTADLFVSPSPPGGLLVAAQVDLDRLVRRCRSVGVEIEIDGQILRARSGPLPGGPAPKAGRKGSTRTSR